MGMSHTISPNQSIYHNHYCPVVMRNEQRPDDGLRNCDAPIQRVPEVAGLRSDPRCHGNRRQHGDLPALSVAIS